MIAYIVCQDPLNERLTGSEYVESRSGLITCNYTMQREAEA